MKKFFKERFFKGPIFKEPGAPQKNKDMRPTLSLLIKLLALLGVFFIALNIDFHALIDSVGAQAPPPILRGSGTPGHLLRWVRPTFDYNLSAELAEIEIDPGSSGVNTITAAINTLPQLTQPVTLSISGALPAWVRLASPAFSNNPCNPTCSSALTLTVDAAARPGDRIPITVAGSPLGKNTTFTLVVGSGGCGAACLPFAYTLAFTRPTVTIVKGLSDTNDLIATLVAGSGRVVTSLDSAAPAGVAFSWQPLTSPCDLGVSTNACNSTLRISVSSTATSCPAASPCTVAVRGVAGGLPDQTPSFQLIIQNPSTPPPSSRPITPKWKEVKPK